VWRTRGKVGEVQCLICEVKHELGVSLVCHCVHIFFRAHGVDFKDCVFDAWFPTLGLMVVTLSLKQMPVRALTDHGNTSMASY
jgi:hypothetical protein